LRVVALGLGVAPFFALCLVVACCGEPEPEPEPIYYPTEELPGHLVPCSGIAPDTESMTSSETGRVWLAFTMTEWAESTPCVEEVDGPWSLGSDDLIAETAPQRGVFVTWTDDWGGSFRALQRLSDGSETEAIYAVESVAAGGGTVAVALAATEGAQSWIRVVWSDDEGLSWSAPVDLGRPGGSEPGGSAFRGLRVGTDGGLEVVAESAFMEPVFWHARTSDGLQLRELPTSLLPVRGLAPGPSSFVLAGVGEDEDGDYVHRLLDTSDPDLTVHELDVAAPDGWSFDNDAIALSVATGVVVLNRLENGDGEVSCVSLLVADPSDPNVDLLEHPAEGSACAHERRLPHGSADGSGWTSTAQLLDDEPVGYRLVWGWEDAAPLRSASVAFWHGQEDPEAGYSFAATVPPGWEEASVFGDGMFYRLPLPVSR